MSDHQQYERPRSAEGHDRRAFLEAASGLAGALAALGLPARDAFAQQATAGPIVETVAGRVRGTTRSGIHIFKGVRYGATTGGANRFMRPRAPAPWSGVRDALDYGAAAPQLRDLPQTSEDCLFLNVWTPGIDEISRRPVMVWLHGGGFREGSGSSSTNDGVNLCTAGDVVVVTINHRLNIFGSLYLADIAGNDFAVAGHAGMLDIVAALEWVRDNIASFGGDPGNVTVFGESGGGRKVTTLLSMPAAQGLFHRAIIQSGALLRLREPEDAVRETDALLRALGIERSRARELRQVSTETLIGAYSTIAGRIAPDEHVVGMTANTPVIDGSDLPGHPFEPKAPTVSADIPVLVGYNRTEETFYWRNRRMLLEMNDAELATHVAERLRSEAAAPRVIDTYRDAYPGARPWDLYMLICTDHPRGIYARELAKRKNALAAAPAWLYRFDWDMGGELKTPHTLDIPFVFNNLDRAETGSLDVPATAASRALAQTMSGTWIAFARNGDPHTVDLPDWPAYKAEDRAAMLFNDASRVVRDHDREPRLAMEAVLGLS